MTNYLQRKPGSIEELAAKMSSNIKEDEYQKLFKKELDKAGKGIGSMTPAEKKSFFNKIDKMYKGKNEAVDNPYAVGMAAAMKKTGDKPPLKKSTITKAHDIAKSIEKDQKEDYTNKDVDKFHKKLDKLVHKSFGHSSDEKKMKKEEVNESDAYDNDRFAIVNGKAKVDNSNTPDKANHVYAPNAKTAEAMYKKGVKKFLDTTAMRNKFPTYNEAKEVDELTAAQKKLPPALQKAIKKKEDAKEEVEETHSYTTNKQNQKQKDAKGEKDVVDPEPKLKKPSMNEQTAKQQSLMKSIYDVWTNSAEELEEMKKSAKYMKSQTDVDAKADVEEEETVKEANINTDNVKKGDSAKEKELKIKLDKEKDTDALEKQLVAAQAQIGLLKQKLENEKHRTVRPEPNPDTGEVPLTVGVAYKHLKDKMKKEETDEKDEKSDEKKKTMVGTKKTPVETKPTVDYKM